MGAQGSSGNRPPNQPQAINPENWQDKIFEENIALKWYCDDPDPEDKLTYSILLDEREAGGEEGYVYKSSFKFFQFKLLNFSVSNFSNF